MTSLLPRPGHFPAKAKSVIWLFMEGAPSAVDMFDRKPELDKRDGDTTDIQAFFGNPGPLMKSPFSFKQYGECGQWVCDKYTNVAKHVDKMAFIKSCYTANRMTTYQRSTKSTVDCPVRAFPPLEPG